MKRIYDWQILKNQFILGSWISIVAFFKDQGIKNNSRSRTSARGWIKERRHYIEKINLQAQQRFIEDETSIRVRHQKAALELQLKGLKELEKQPIRSVDDARKLIVDGMREEREALGLNA